MSEERRKKSIAGMWTTEKKIFRNKALLKVSYIPDSINDVVNREIVIRKFQTCLIDVKQNIAPNNIIIYGKPGTGKTLISRLVLKDLKEVAAEFEIKITVINVSCELAKTENGIIGSINNQLLSEMYGELKISVGNSVSRNNIKFNNYFNNLDGILIILLDEIDKIKDPDLINNLARTISTKNNQPPCLVLITNDINFKESLKGHTRSILAENEIQFDPYDAEQLNEILSARIKKAFFPGVVGEMVVPLCSAFAAQEHGDARKAINLLCKAGEVAESKGKEIIEENEVREANELIDIDRVSEVVSTLPTQSKLILYSIIQLIRAGREGKIVTINEVYNVYRQVCLNVEVDILTQRRINDLISELDILGIINAVVAYKGRYGRIKEISLSVPVENTHKVLLEDYRLKSLVDFKMSVFKKIFS
jgi:archaeal cell division control protein 6